MFTKVVNQYINVCEMYTNPIAPFATSSSAGSFLRNISGASEIKGGGLIYTPTLFRKDCRMGLFAHPIFYAPNILTRLAISPKSFAPIGDNSPDWRLIVMMLSGWGDLPLFFENATSELLLRRNSSFLDLRPTSQSLSVASHIG